MNKANHDQTYKKKLGCGSVVSLIADFNDDFYTSLQSLGNFYNKDIYLTTYISPAFICALA